MRSDGMPDLADAELYVAARRSGSDWSQLKTALATQLDLVQIIALMASSSVADVQSPRGRPTMVARDQLLADVIGRMPTGMKREPARQLAHEILRACGIGTPAVTALDGARAIKKAARRGQKRV